MSRLKLTIVLAATTAVVAAAIAWGGTPTAQVTRSGRGYAPVKVLNTATEPVPIQGTTTVAGTADVRVTNLPLPVAVDNTPLPTVAQGVTQVSGAVQAVQSGAWTMAVAGTADVNVANTPSVNVANSPSVTVANSPTVEVGNGPGNPVYVASVPTAVSGLPALEKTLGGPATFSAGASTSMHDIYTSWAPLTICLTVDNFGSGTVQFFFEVGAVSRSHLVPANKMETGCSDSVDRITFQCASGCEFDWRIDQP